MGAGSRIADERERQGMTQADLAAQVSRLGYKITQQGIDKIEKRDTQRPKCLKELAIALKVTEEWLLTGIEPRDKAHDFRLTELSADIRKLQADEQETLYAQFRSLLDIAIRKDLKKLK